MSLIKDDIERKKKIYIVSEYVDKTRNSTGYYWHKIISGLSRSRPGICVISARESCDRVDRADHSATYIPVSGIRNSNKSSLFIRALGQVSLSVSFITAIVRHVRKGDIVFSGTNPSFMLLFIALLKPLVGFRWALLVHDVFPENLVPAKVASDKSLLYRVMKYMFDRSYSSADSLIAIGRDMQKLLQSKTRSHSNIVYVPNWADLDDVTLERSSLGGYGASETAGRVVFQFFGNIGRAQGVNYLLEAISRVRSSRAAFLFIGGGAAESEIANFIARNSAIDVTHIPYLPFGRNNEGLSACDIAMISLAPGMLGLGVPSKAYFSMAADKPILAIGDEGSELQLLIEENPDVGWFCKAADSEALASLIDTICSAGIDDKVKKPRALIAEKYGYAQAIEKYLRVLSGLEADGGALKAEL